MIKTKADMKTKAKKTEKVIIEKTYNSVSMSQIKIDTEDDVLGQTIMDIIQKLDPDGRLRMQEILLNC